MSRRAAQHPSVATLRELEHRRAVRRLSGRAIRPVARPAPVGRWLQAPGPLDTALAELPPAGPCSTRPVVWCCPKPYWPHETAQSIQDLEAAEPRARAAAAEAVLVAVQLPGLPGGPAGRRYIGEQARVVARQCGQALGVSDLFEQGAGLAVLLKGEVAMAGHPLVPGAWFGALERGVGATALELAGVASAERPVVTGPEASVLLVAAETLEVAEAGGEWAGQLGWLVAKAASWGAFSYTMAQLQPLAALLRLERLEPGSRLYVLGEPASKAWLLCSGSVELKIELELRRRGSCCIDRDEKVVQTLGPGGIAGTAALLPGSTHRQTTSAVCATAVVAYVLDAAQFEALCKADPERMSLEWPAPAGLRSFALDDTCHLGRLVKRYRRETTDTSNGLEAGLSPRSRIAEREVLRPALRACSGPVPLFSPGDEVLRKICTGQSPLQWAETSELVPLTEIQPPFARAGSTLYVPHVVPPIREYRCRSLHHDRWVVSPTPGFDAETVNNECSKRHPAAQEGPLSRVEQLRLLREHVAQFRLEIVAAEKEALLEHELREPATYREQARTTEIFLKTINRIKFARVNHERSEMESEIYDQLVSVNDEAASRLARLKAALAKSEARCDLLQEELAPGRSDRIAQAAEAAHASLGHLYYAPIRKRIGEAVYEAEPKHTQTEDDPDP